MRAVGIFVKAPVPGRVKRRLAADIGPSSAAEVYWRLGRQVVGSTVGAGHRTTVWFTPEREGRFVREWLEGLGRVAFRAQRGAGLGARLTHAFAAEFATGARRVVIVGSDCPGVDRRMIRGAFTALGEHDLVLGPALDGGYYLIGLTAPRPALFRAIRWSTAAVAVQTRARARALGLSCHLLKPLRDVDTVRDAHLLGLLNS
ncbi:MAG TPA: TIGR04282 family arsenosugar biosynthesis glycosyltransferase [Gemmatimonadales bacterium]|nr:TIGR04282 family arsenosugar biosynthesis glycosyltransferase [Gemmatimonadales bacterium]